MDRPFAEILGDLGPGVVCAEGLLVDVLLEDVAEHVGVDLVVLAAGRVVEVPGVAVEEVEQVLEGPIGDVDLRVFLLDLVRQEQAAVEVLDLAEQLAWPRRIASPPAWRSPRRRAPGGTRSRSDPCPAVLDSVELVAQVVLVAAVEEPGRLLLQEVDEHQPVQQDRGVPAPLPFVGDAADQLQERDVLVLELAEELLGDPFDIEGGLQPPCDLDDADVALGVELAEVEDHLAELAEEQVAGLALEIEVIARELLTVLPLDPVPEALGSLAVDEDQQVLVVMLGDFLVDGGARLGIRDRAVVCLDFQDDGPGQFGDVPADESRCP